MSEAMTALIEKRDALTNRMKTCHVQGQDPSQVPLSLAQGRDILDLFIKVLDEVNDHTQHHHHTYKVGGHDKSTSDAQ